MRVSISALLLLVFVAVASLTITFAMDDTLPAQPIVWPYQSAAVRAQALDRDLAKRDAEIVGLRADIAVCQANTEQAKRDYQSLVLTNDVAKAVDRLKAQFPGTDWIWDNDQRRIVPVKSPSDNSQKESPK